MKDIFNRIAPAWYNYRHWSIFRKELETIAAKWDGGRLLNIGCAHGPDFLPFKDNFELSGVDISDEMIILAEKYARKFGFTAELTVADARALPFTDASFDWAISLAAYHHLLNRNDQLQAFLELRRVLKPGGQAFITVWNRCQPRFWFKGQTVQVPWRAKAETIYRGYYLFRYGELEGRLRQAGLKVLDSFPESMYRFPVKYFSRNICIIVERQL
ncbi:class I SAM-dependent methyltransferase [Chloroflexota bacterium]